MQRQGFHVSPVHQALVLALLVAGCAPPPARMPPSHQVGKAHSVPIPLEASAPPNPMDAAPSGGSTADKPSAQEAGRIGGKVVAVDLTPFTRFEDRWFQASSHGYGQGGIFEGNYTRVLIQPAGEASATGDGTPLGYAPRGWLARLLVGKSFSVNFTLGIKAGLYTATIPVVTLSHASSLNEGEQWSRSIGHTLDNNPLFLVNGSDSTATPEITFELKGGIKYTSTVASRAVDVATKLAGDISPAAPFVTTLSAPALANQALALDSAISSLLGSGIDEKNVTQDPIRWWRYDQGMQIALSIPASEHNFNSAGSMPVGTWRLSFEEPRPSVFVEWRICPGFPVVVPAGVFPPMLFNPANRCAADRATAIKLVHRELDPAKVLNTALAGFGPQGSAATSMGTISAYLSQQDWYKAALAVLGDEAKGADAAAPFCKHVRLDIVAVGLNDVDADIVLWAIDKATPELSAKAIHALEHDDTCGAVISRIDHDQIASR